MSKVKPKFAFCGYPVPTPSSDLCWFISLDGECWRPCGKIASPGCAYCYEHAGCTVDDLPPLTADEIVDRATDRELQRMINQNTLKIIVGAVVILLMIFVALLQPVHSWLQAHLEFLGGVLAGSVATGTWWGIWRWQKGDRP